MGRAGPTYIGLVTTGLEDELLGLVLPALHRGVGGSQAGRAEGQLGLAGLLLRHTCSWTLLTCSRELTGCSLPEEWGSQ